MKFSTTILASFLALAAAAPGNPKFVSFPVKHSSDSQHAKSLQARGDALPIPLTNRDSYYSVTLGLGTPPQQFTLLLDTGSSDLWVYNATDTENCSHNGCANTGTYNETLSSTYKFKSDDYLIEYVKGNATGNWVTDTLTLKEVTLPDFQFAVASRAQMNSGILGISTLASEAVKKEDRYPNFPAALKNAGYIDRVVYSLYLNSANDKMGTFLVGGVDHAKYKGSLAVLPWTQTYAFQVNYNGISVDGTRVGGKNKAVLDSGSANTFIPRDAYEALAKKLNLSPPDKNTGQATIDCNIDVSVDFEFDGVTIKALKEQLVRDVGKNKCTFMIRSAAYSAGNIIFGDSFLRNAYAVFDLEAREIGIAQAVYTQDTNIQAQTGPLKK